ncbi:MAG: cobalt transporter [Betaproteobacteria bacterium]|nr:cobalt transporter [Betaproteobacteria bacterium]
MPLTGQKRFRNIVVSALLAGLITGMLATLVQMFTTIPLIARAEVYEPSSATLPQPARQAEHHHIAPWKPSEGFERIFYTGLSTVLVAMGYGLILAALLAHFNWSGWRDGLVLGAAGFIVFQLAPALGLPPRPPGVPEAELAARQTWWLGTVVATALGLGALYWARTHSKAIWILVGVVLLALPHVIGAPQPVDWQPAVPQSLAQQFAIVALITTAIFWLMLGSIEGMIFSRLLRR